VDRKTSSVGVKRGVCEEGDSRIEERGGWENSPWPPSKVKRGGFTKPSLPLGSSLGNDAFRCLKGEKGGPTRMGSKLLHSCVGNKIGM